MNPAQESGGELAAHESAGGRPGGLFYTLGRVELRFAQLCVVVMTALVLTSAIARTVGTPMNWTVDLATFTFAWAVFIGADVAWRRDRMVSIDILVDRLPAVARRWVQLACTVLVAALLAALVITGTMLAADASDRSFDGVPWLSYTWVTMAVPIGCLLMLITTGHKLRSQIQSLRGRHGEVTP
ncbi:TRAP transporter small permease [Ruania zhangjianzhongii]|uniref:TRAP transporter small permease n=1 Tax=Ruania zhangjianzhongii TaxID=2603206 RepID=UPI0011CC9EE8|nr:TRAP transporter small permease [Ruania zhangjianzhongii]